MEFRAKVLDGSSGVTTCVIDAVNEADARRQMALRDLRVISLEPVRRLRRMLQSPQLHLTVFSQQLVSLLDAGLSPPKWKLNPVVLSGWWDQHAEAMTELQRDKVWEALDRVRFYEIVETTIDLEE